MDPPNAYRPTQKREWERGKDIRKKIEGKINLKKEKKKKELSYESSFEGIRLTTSPCTRSRHARASCTVQKSFGQARQNIYIQHVLFHLT